MKGKFYMSFFVLSFFSITVSAQSENKKTDSVTSARQIMSKNQGEKNFPAQLKKGQLQKSPEVLKDSATAVTPATNKSTKNKCDKHKKENK